MPLLNQLDTSLYRGNPVAGPNQDPGMQPPQLPPALLLKLQQMMSGVGAGSFASAIAPSISIPPVPPAAQAGRALMPPFPPTTMPQMNPDLAPNQGQQGYALQKASQPSPQSAFPTIPNDMSGMGMGATAPQVMPGMPKQQGAFGDLPGIKNQLFEQYLKLYPDGVS
jgi:hypothetical protein